MSDSKYAHWDYIATHDCFSCSSCKYDSDVVLNTCPNCKSVMRDREELIELCQKD